MSDWIFWCFLIAPISFFYFLYWGLVHLQRASDQVAYKETKSYLKTLRRVQASAIVFAITGCVVFENVSFVKSTNVPDSAGGERPSIQAAAQVIRADEAVHEIGRWSVSEAQSPMDDSKTVMLGLDADAPIQAWLETPTPSLWIRCKEHKTSVYIYTGSPTSPEYGEYGTAKVRIRFDKGAAVTQRWTLTTDSKGLVAPAGAVALARRVANAETMIFQFTPHNASPATATFMVKGLKEKLPLVAQACGWKP
jgi:type VI secretion system protein VasI